MIRPLLALLLLSLPLAAQAPPPLREVVVRFDNAQAQAQTLQCPFTLTLHRALLKTPSVTKGTMYLQGSDFVHFAFQPPEDLILHLTPKALISYSPEAREGELMKIGFIKNSDRKFLGLGQKLSYLSDYFQIALSDAKDIPNAWHLALSPRTLSLKRRLQALNLWVDKETWLPRQVQWIERSGDSWFLELGALKINQPLPASVTGFKLPEGIPLRSEFSFFATRKK
ncbi:MAG: outer membrane lipoprotein carrier protein LolA [Acidobacteria bacterium]|nr:outer membrane lipoprotein carrier protein LolA [Acidobacteriota bacterium]MBI3489828.1 outer membrane lipoprotein carrier protein LolA [Acidobacteriota bacterium]